MPIRTQNRIAAALVLLAVAGMGVSATIGRIHHRLTVEAGYTSFCNVSSRVNCDAVLTSTYASLLGLPMSSWALLFYGAIVLLAVVFVVSVDRGRRNLVAKLLFLAQVWGLLLAVYLAGVAFVVLQTVCLMCAALYVVSMLSLPTAWWLLSATGDCGRGAVFGDGFVRLGMVAAVVGVAGVGFVQAWERARSSGGRDAAGVCAADPQFCNWFTAQPRLQVPGGGGHSRGPDTAEVTIVEFSDFACGHCRGFRDTLDTLQAGAGQNVRLVFRHFPLDGSCNGAVQSSIHPDACLAAVASECAGEQGQFWAYHDTLFENQKALGRPFLLQYAERIGLDVGRFTVCLDSPAPRARVEADTRVAAALGVESTPTVFLNGRRIAGALDGRGLTDALVLTRSATRESEPSH